MEDEINLLDYWRVVVKRKWLIIGLTILTAFSALVYSLMQPKLYKATATIMPVDTGGGGLASALMAVPFLGGAGGGSGGEAKLVPLLESATLANQVAQNSDEKRSGITAGALRDAVEAKGKGGLLAISIIWPEPEQAAELANRYVEQLGKFLNMRSLNVNFHVVDPAVAPSSHFKPNIKKNVMIGTIFGLFMGTFIAFFLEHLENLPKIAQKL